jgi:DNA-binding FadR family transcriptional regulator
MPGRARSADRGPTAAPINPMEVMEVRLRIEPQIAQLAALRARPEAIERMTLVDRLDATGDGDERELWDSAFHREIARATENRMFLMIFDAVDRARHDDAVARPAPARAQHGEFRAVPAAAPGDPRRDRRAQPGRGG